MVSAKATDVEARKRATTVYLVSRQMQWMIDVEDYDIFMLILYYLYEYLSI